MTLNPCGKGFLKHGTCHQAYKKIEIKKDEDGQEVFAVNAHGVKGTVDIKGNGLQSPHKGVFGHALFVERNHGHTDRRRFDGGLNGLVRIPRHNEARAIDVGKHVPLTLCFDGL